MRIVYTIMIGIMLGGIVAAGAWRAHTEREWDSRIRETRSELQRLEREISIRAALRDVPMSERGYPLKIDPSWFEGGRPYNALLSGARPWLEISASSQRDLRHPNDPIAMNGLQAVFWYNPHTGDVRARVPAQPTEEASFELYNKVNGSALYPR